MSRMIRAVLALVGLALLAGCDDDGNNTRKPAPPQAFITVDESYFIRGTSQGVSGTMNASGCKRIVGLEVWEGSKFVKQYGNPDGGTTVPVDFTLEEGLLTELYKERGFALPLSLRTKVTCDDGRTNFSQSVGTNYFPVMTRKESPVPGEFTVPENFVGEGTGGDHVNFLGCTGNGAGGSQLSRVDGTTFEVLNQNANLPAACTCRADSIISARNTTTNTRWMLTPGSGLALIDNSNLSLVRCVTGPWVRMGVSPTDGSAAVFAQDNSMQKLRFVWPDNGSAGNDWEANSLSGGLGGFMIATPVITTDAVWTAHFVQGIGSTDGEIVVAKWSKFTVGSTPGGTNMNKDADNAFGHTVHTLIYGNTLDPTIVPEGAFYSDATNFMFPVWTVVNGTVTTHVSNCATGPTGACLFFDQGLPGVIRYLIPFSGNAIVAAISAREVYFLNGTSQSYPPLNNKPIVPSASNIVAGVQWATNGQFYVATRPPTMPQPNELIGIDSPQAGELWRLSYGGGSSTADGVNLTVAGNDAPPADTSLFVWVRLGLDLAKLQSPSWYRGRRGPTP